VWLGDSYPAEGNNGIPRYTEQFAQAAGALAAGATYRKYYASGAMMANGQIPAQYSEARQADPDITTVIMNGGGNDIISSSATCIANPPPANQSCISTVAQGVAGAAQALFTRMQADGVKNTIYYFYPRTTLANTAADVDAAFPIVKAACDKFNGPMNCHFVDTRPPFEQQNWFSDGVHPTDPGQQAIAGLIWSTMVSHCVAQ
jgi:lysophospholipase L1-like esterase